MIESIMGNSYVNRSTILWSYIMPFYAHRYWYRPIVKGISYFISNPVLHFLLLFFHIQKVEGQLPNQPCSLPAQRLISDYLLSVEKDSSMKLVEIKSIIPTIRYDFKYAGRNNFVRKRMYPSGLKTTFLRLPAARALAHVQEELRKEGLGLKIFDAYRPYSVTYAFWRLIQDERYVANPAKGSGHNRGIAIDLTIINLQTGKEIEMGTGFDNFSDTAHHRFNHLPEETIQNRRKLKSFMGKAGFLPLETEWWHYSWPNDKNYPVMDIPFNKMNEIRIRK